MNRSLTLFLKEANEQVFGFERYGHLMSGIKVIQAYATKKSWGIWVHNFLQHRLTLQWTGLIIREI
jgi:hypothetical protein